MPQITSFIFQAVHRLYESVNDFYILNPVYIPSTLFPVIPIFVLTLTIYLENVARGHKRMYQPVNPYYESASVLKLFHSISHKARAPYFL